MQDSFWQGMANATGAVVITCENPERVFRPMKIQIVSNRASKAEIYDDFEAVKAAGYEVGERDFEHSQLRAELRNQPTIKGLCGPMWGGWRDANGESVYLKNNDKSAEVESYSPGKVPDHYLVRYEDWESYDLLSR